MSLSFNEAVDYLKGMFPAWDRDSLGAMLSANEGRMGRTIDELLTMDVKKIPNQPNRLEVMRARRTSLKMGAVSSPTRPPLESQKSNRKVNPNYRNRVEHNVVYRGVKFVLPDSFLALPEDGTKLAGKKKPRTVYDDDHLTEVLQNDEFLHKLEAYGYSFRPGEGPESEVEAAAEPQQPAAKAVPPPVKVEELKSTVSSLGEKTKRNLSMLAFRFFHGVDEKKPLEDGAQPEFDFDDVYEKDDSVVTMNEK